MKHAMSFRRRDSRKRESSVYDESEPLLSEPLDEKVDLEGEHDVSMCSAGLKKGEGKLFHISKSIPYSSTWTIQ